jgi:Tfp pilus assembly protein PilX
MSNSMSGKKGVVLYLVLASILVALVLASTILNLILNQARFSHHEVSRVQAYYAALAGANYAFEGVRSGNPPSCWLPSSTTTTHYICKTGGTGACATPGSCDLTDDKLPLSVSQVAISLCGTSDPSLPCCLANPRTCTENACCDTWPANTLKIASKAIYTYTTP